MATLDVPPDVHHLWTLARDLGWAASLTYTDGPPCTVQLNAQRGTTRHTALWHLTDDQARWAGPNTPATFTQQLTSQEAA